MRPGTPGFNGARLREAREARGLTASKLASMLGVSRQAISQYEHAKSTPDPEVTLRIANILDLPVAYFLGVWEQTHFTRIFYRSLASATALARRRAEKRLAWLAMIVAHLRKYVEWPVLSVPDFQFSADPLEIDDRAIDDVAAELRRSWGIGSGPVFNTIRLLENQGIIISRDLLGTSAIDAYSAISATRNEVFMVLGSDKGSSVRSRLDAVHELGHLVLHSNVARDSLGDPKFHRIMERQSFRFAGAFLLPAESFAEELARPSLESLLLLKPRWLVSVAMMIKRARDLDFIDSDREQRLWMSYSRRGWKRREPLDEEIAAEQPQLLRDCLSLIFESGVEPPTAFIDSLSLSVRDVVELTGIGESWFEVQDPVSNIVRFRSRTSS